MRSSSQEILVLKEDDVANPVPRGCEKRNLENNPHSTKGLEECTIIRAEPSMIDHLILTSQCVMRCVLSLAVVMIMDRSGPRMGATRESLQSSILAGRMCQN